MPYSTQVCGRTRSLLRRAILPVVKAWPGDHGRRFAQHGRYLLRGELAAIERAEIGELALGGRGG